MLFFAPCLGTYSDEKAMNELYGLLNQEDEGFFISRLGERLTRY